MPIPIRYTTTNVSNSVRLGNIALGVNAVNYGPSSTTGWTNAVPAPNSGYAIYYLSGTDLRIRTAADDATLIIVAGQIMGTTYTSVSGSLAGLAAGGYTAIYNNPPNIVTSGSVLNLNAGLVMSYPRGNTTWYDISGNSNNGTLINGPTFSTSGAIVFDGTNDYVLVNSNSSIPYGSSARTISIWFYTNSSTWVDNVNNLFFYGAGSTGNAFGIDFSTYPFMEIYTWGGAGRDLTFSTTYSQVGWKNISITYDGSTTILIYENGTFTQTLNLSSACNTTLSSVYIGAINPSIQSWYYDGNIAHVSIYNRSLSVSEILQNYYQGNIVTSSLVMALDAGNLVSYPGSGTAWTTLTGSNSGTLTNGPTFSGVNGGVIVFDGVDDTSTTTLTNTGTNNTTQIVWYKWNGINQIKVISYLGDGGSNGLGFLIHDGSGGTAGNKVGVLYGGVAFNALSGGASATLTSGVWCQLAITRDSTTTSLYQNGTLIGTTTASPAGNASSLAFTANFGAGGSISSVLFYTKSLSASEVVQNFNAYKNRFNL
jgi:hypothetical protein